ncbi:protein of unknown function DUF805 [Kribbella flavida DSM 17836]|uniref:DUF805 domain-containing protein n=1 Tax=Kribbella flavida (strain DSM 17836 / JCM 10339 / NBRC 14399) TaxID=479435 RepID=D2Q499_KRIFD|nr:DUF805 domain-containing protein [Kribbella flavida]ADB30413.1 protein of unknown function DUF805 [Kribbella flavida DSM 17836]
MRWYLTVLTKYAVFRGRAGREEFWFFTLANLIVSVLLAVADRLTGADWPAGVGPLPIGPIEGVYTVLVLLPTLAVTVRRLHDTDRSGAWLLLYLVPVIGWLVLLVLNAQAGTRGDNKYGPDPRPAGLAASTL